MGRASAALEHRQMLADVVIVLTFSPLAVNSGVEAGVCISQHHACCHL